MNISEYEWYMSKALDQAQIASSMDEVPVGALIVSADGKELGAAGNEKESLKNPCAHAEILAIQRACEKMENWRLTGCTLFVTLEPCPMCLAAMIQARIERLVFGAYDTKGGALGLGYNLHNDSRLNHRFSVVGGIRHFECSKIMSDFFRRKRDGYNISNKF